MKLFEGHVTGHLVVKVEGSRVVGLLKGALVNDKVLFEFKIPKEEKKVEKKKKKKK